MNNAILMLSICGGMLLVVIGLATVGLWLMFRNHK
jgi:hypothetical protein